MGRRGRRALNRPFVENVSKRLNAAAESLGVEVSLVMRFVANKRGMNIESIKMHFEGRVCPDAQSLCWYSEDLGVPTDYLLGLDNGSASKLSALARRLVHKMETGETDDIPNPQEEVKEMQKILKKV